MSKAKLTGETIAVDRLVKGLFVDLQLPWSRHPFLFSRFKIKSEQDIAAIRQLGLTEVLILPELSDVEIPDDLGGPGRKETAEVLNAMWQEKTEHIDRAKQYRDRRNVVTQQYHSKASMVRKVALELRTQPANAIHNADDIVENLAEDFERQSDLLTNLVNLGSGEHSFYNHAVNVTILSLMLAAAEGMNGEELRLVGVGALLHDIGKIEIPGKVTNKQGKLNQAEKEVLQRHTILGRRLAEHVRDVRPQVLDIIEHHHEFLDASGYPHRLTEDKISKLVRIVAVANVYDNLCNPPNPYDGLTPKTALALMYTRYKNKLDSSLIERFIRRIGVYPPGTVVRLNDGSIGLVVTVDPKTLLKPELLIYNPDIPKEQALIVDLKEYEDLSVQEVLSPKDYPERIYQYLGMKERLGYFVEKRP